MQQGASPLFPNSLGCSQLDHPIPDTYPYLRDIYRTTAETRQSLRSDEIQPIRSRYRFLQASQIQCCTRSPNEYPRSVTSLDKQATFRRITLPIIEKKRSLRRDFSFFSFSEVCLISPRTYESPRPNAVSAQTKWSSEA